MRMEKKIIELFITIINNKMSLKSIFKEALNVLQDIGSKNHIETEKLIDIYGMYKQITCGNVQFNNNFKTLKEKRLWESWNSFKGLDKTEGMTIFTKIVYELVYKYNN